MAGGAITAKSIPKEEYEECLVKVKAILEIAEAMGGKNVTPKEDVVETPQDKQALDNARKRRGRIDYFGILGITKGTKLTFSKDKNI